MRNVLSMAILVATALFFPFLTSAQESTKLQDADMDFVKQATAAGMAEVDLGKLGAAKGSDQFVRQFAQRMVDDHSKANQQLLKLLADKKVEVPKDWAPIKDQLSGLSGADFDREFMAHMVSDHEKAVAVLERQSRDGKTCN